MASLRQYLIGVTASAIICGIVKSISNEKTLSGAILRLIAGIVMTVTVLSPVVDLKLGDLPVLSGDLLAQASAAAEAGENLASAEINAIIKDRVQAYILDKAAAFGAALQVEVTMPDDGSRLPEAVTLYGSVAPYAKVRLQRIIAEDLQIAKEKQQWIG